MNILSSIQRETMRFFEQSLLPALNAQQKRIGAIALMALSCLAVSYALYRCCFKEKKIVSLQEPSNIIKPLQTPSDIPVIATETCQKYQAGIKTFSFEVLRKIVDQSSMENQLVSPIGISYLLSMIKHGVGLSNQTEINDHLHLPESENDLKVSAYKFVTKLIQSGLDFAGLLYLNPKYRLDSDYQSLISQYYRSTVATGSAAADVNAWVTKATNGQIQEIVAQKDLRNLFLVLANAIHFKGVWQTAFKARNTYPDVFSTTPTEKIRIPMMHLTSYFQYAENAKCEAVKLAYRDKREFSMVLVLPKQDQDFACIDETLFTELLANMHGEEVDLTLPKFKIESEMDVKKFLHEMGIHQIFEKPDFSPMVDFNHAPTKSVLSELEISQMKQKSALTCDEEGTEASSATVAIVCTKGCPPEEPPKVLAFNRPFLAALVYQDTPVLFGLIRNPEVSVG